MDGCFFNNFTAKCEMVFTLIRRGLSRLSRDAGKAGKQAIFEHFAGKAGKNTTFSHATAGKAGNLLLVNIICINQNHTIILIFQLL